MYESSLLYSSFGIVYHIFVTTPMNIGIPVASSTIIKTNGDTFRHEGFTKVLSENVVKIAKQANKEVGYKYVGRFKDTHGRYCTKYARMAEELSNSEREVIYFVTITTLK